MTDLTREQIEETRRQANGGSFAVHSSAVHALCDMALRTEAAERERDEVRKLAYVPGVWKCAKCGCVIVSTLIHAETGQFAANREPQQCPNDCGPMWMRTEREAGNELIDRMDAEIEKRTVADARAEKLEAALRALLGEWDKLSRYGSPLEKSGNEAVNFAREALAPDRRTED